MQVILDVCGLRWLTVERLKPKSKTSSASCGQRSRHFWARTISSAWNHHEQSIRELIDMRDQSAMLDIG
jgi:hypothetical protein